MEKEIDNNAFVMPRLGLGEQLLSEYDLEVEGVAKGRGSLLVFSGKQTYMLKEFRGSRDKAKALAQVLALLRQWDEMNEVLVATKEGDYLVKEEGGPAYLLKEYHGGKECDVKNPLEIMEGVRKLGALHMELREVELENKEAFCAPEHGLPQELYRHNREMRNLKNYIRKKKGANPFEEQYIKVYDVFYHQAVAVEERINEDAFFLRKPMHLCHGDFHYHNVVECSNKSLVVHFENMRLDSQISDLAKYVRKALEKNHWDRELGMHMLLAYDKVCNLCEKEWKELYLRLSYPEKFWKITNHYNNNKKAWASKRDGEKLKQLLGQESARQEFLVWLYNQIE